MFRKILNHFLNSFNHKMTSNENLKYRNKPIIIIFGCTGTGKTKLSVELAKKYNAEIINADAIQVIYADLENLDD